MALIASFHPVKECVASKNEQHSCSVKMIRQKIEARYIDKIKLTHLLEQLFRGTFTVKVCCKLGLSSPYLNCAREIV